MQTHTRTILLFTLLFSSSITSLLQAQPKLQAQSQHSLYIGGGVIPEPVKIVESQTNILLSELSNRKSEFDEDPQKLITFARDVALAHWDFNKVSRIILGPYWKKATIKNRDLFVNEFLRTILRYVVKAYGYYDDSLVRIVSYKWQQRKRGGWVQSIVRLPAGLKLAVDYRMYQNHEKQWKLIDVRVEGISLVQSKQSEYRELAHDESFASLLKMMIEKNQAVL